MSASHRGWTLALTSIAYFMVALDALVVITALPSIQHDLGASLSTLEWTVNAYGLAFAGGIITAAALGDRVGRRRLFIAGVALFTISSAVCALSPSIGILIAARTVQGLGAAVIMPLSLTLLTSAFPPERRGAIIGIWGGISGLAVAGGPLVGGAITQNLTWHWIFWVNVPIGLAVVALSRFGLTESRGPATDLDVPGVSFIVGGATGVIWGLIRGNESGWGSPEIVGSLAIGVVLLAAFVWWESRVEEPMLPIRLFRHRAFVASNLTAFLMMGALISAAFLSSQYFQFVLRNSPFDTGLKLLPWTATPVLIAPVAGALSDRLGRRPIMFTGTLLQGVGLVWLALISTTGVNYLNLVVPFIVAGVGISMALPTVATAVISSVAPGDVGKASGVNSTMQRFGGVFGIAIAAAVFAGNGHIGSPASFDAGFQPALGVSAALSLLAAVSALAVTPHRTAASVPALATESAA